MMFLNRFKDKLAIIPIEGPIMDGKMGLFPSFMKSSLEQSEEYLDKIRDDKHYKGLILEINSPGGSPYKSKQLARKIDSLNIFKVALIQEQGTSGAYWIASVCDKIVADDLSTIGGVGTISIRPDLTDFLEKLGINIDVQGEGKFKGEGMPFSEMTEEEKKHRRKMVKDMNELFKNQIKERRNIKKDSEVFEGKVFLGREAKKVGLVDHLGGRDTARKVFEKNTGITGLKLKDFSEEMRKGPSLLDFIR